MSLCVVFKETCSQANLQSTVRQIKQHTWTTKLHNDFVLSQLFLSFSGHIDDLYINHLAVFVIHLLLFEQHNLLQLCGCCS